VGILQVPNILPFSADTGKEVGLGNLLGLISSAATEIKRKRNALAHKRTD
jgi:hypothetical protein